MEAPYTRYPVYRDSLDTVIGILHIRDLMREGNAQGGYDKVDVEALLRPAHVVPETKDLAALLHDFRRTKEHLAVVVDEYGTTEGIVTLEDLLEEIVGEIEDEFDLPDESVEQLADGRIRISGTFSVDDFNEQFDRSLPVDDYHTMAGFVFGLLGRAPEPGRRGGARRHALHRGRRRGHADRAPRGRVHAPSKPLRKKTKTDGQPSAAASALCPARSTGSPCDVSTRSRGSSSSGRNALRTAGWPPLPTQRAGQIRSGSPSSTSPATSARCGGSR